MELKFWIASLRAPHSSPPRARDYFAAMKCGLNMSFANRQVILHQIREVFSEVFGRSAEDLGMQMIYDVAHNTAKLEKHIVDGKEKTLLVHRKGATRAFGPGRDEVAARYREIGQPVDHWRFDGNWFLSARGHNIRRRDIFQYSARKRPHNEPHQGAQAMAR